MALFEWNESFMTSIDKIDEQHKTLVSLVNKLHEAMQNRNAKDVIKGILDELAQYAVYHFSTEEELFKQANYIFQEEHKKEHLNFINTVKDLIEKYNKGNLTINIDTMNFLVAWVKNHIKKNDMKYVKPIKEYFEKNK